MTAFGSYKPQVVVEVASARARKRGGRARPGLPQAGEAPQPTKAQKALLEKCGAECQGEIKQWHARMAEHELYAMKRVRVLGWKRLQGADLKLDRLSDLPANRWRTNCPNDLGVTST